MYERFVFLWGAVLLLWVRPAAALDVVLTVKEPTSVARTNEVVTTGVPLPIGTQTANWRLLDSTNTEIPMSFEVLPGRTKWLLVQFQSTNTAGQTKTYTLRDLAKTATLAAPVNVVEDGFSFIVTTGKIKATISKGANYKGLTQVIYDADANGTYADPAEVIVGAPTTFTSIINAQDALTYTGDGNVTNMSLEYDNDHRVVLRVDGEYKNGSTVYVTYTTRFLFRAGSPQIEVEHIIRNNLQTAQREVKFSSLPLVIGGGTVTGTAAAFWDRRYFNVGTAGLTFQIMPVTAYGVSTSTNGGWILPDLANWTTSLYLDFETGLTAPTVTSRTSAARNPMMALAPARWFSDYGELGTSRFSTTQDEKDANDLWGWSWSAGAVPCDTQNDTAYVGWDNLDVHGDAEADDLWQNILMYVRTDGCRGYFNRARSFYRYYRDDYAFRTEGFNYAWDNTKEGVVPGPGYPGGGAPDFPYVRNVTPLTKTTADTSYLSAKVTGGRYDQRSQIGCHLFLGGLIDWYYLTGDVESLQAAKDLGEISERFWYWRATGYDLNVSGLRAAGRHLESATRLMEVSYGTSEQSRWWQLGAEISRLLVGDTISWTLFDSDTSGFYSHGELNVEGAIGNTSAYNPPLNARGHSGNERALLAHAEWRYYRLVGDTTNGLIHKDRLIKLATFLKNHVISPTLNFTGNYISINNPAIGNVNYHKISAVPTEYRQEWQSYAINALVIGYKLTGDSAMLQLTRGLWSRFSKTNDALSGPVPPTIPADPSPSSRWLNQSFSGGGDIYLENCCMLYASLLFAAHVDAQTTPWTQYGSTTNLDLNGYAVGQPAIAVDSANDIYVATAQERQPSTFGAGGVDCSNIDVAKLVSGNWSHLGTPLGHANGYALGGLIYGYCDAWAPSIVTIGTTPYVAWYESNGYGWDAGTGAPSTATVEASCFVAQWNGSAWTELTGNRGNGSIAAGALASTGCKYPKLANIGGTLYLITIEQPSGTTAQRVAAFHWDGSAWVQDGTPFQINTSTGTFIQDAQIASVGGVPHIVWSEWRHTGSGSTGWNNATAGVQVRKLDAGVWVNVGTTLHAQHPQHVAITSVSSTPYVAWVERTVTGPPQVFVKHFNGTTWVADGTAQNLNTTSGWAGRPALTTDGTDVWLGWSEYESGQTAKVYARKLTVSSGVWGSIEGPLNTHANQTARSVAMTAKSGVPHIVWNERHTGSQTSQTYLFARDSGGTGTMPTLNLWHAGGTAPAPVAGAWITLPPGGITNGGINVHDEGFNTFRWNPVLGMGLVYGQYHTFPSNGSGETQHSLFGWHYDTNRWELLDVGDASGSEHLPASGHDQGQNVVLPDGRYLIKGNHTLNDKTQFLTKIYDVVAAHGVLMRPPLELSNTSESACAVDPTRNQVMCRTGDWFAPWIYDVATNQWAAKGTGPSSRDWSGMAYDNSCDCYVLFGGRLHAGGVNVGDTWEFRPGDGPIGTWTQTTPALSPAPRYSPYLAYDSVAQRVIMTGGGSAETWAYNSTANTWTQLANAPVAMGSRGARLTYAPEKNVLLLYGGSPSDPMYIYRSATTTTPAAPNKLEGTIALSGGVTVE